MSSSNNCSSVAHIRVDFDCHCPHSNSTPHPRRNPERIISIELLPEL
jgi:hypothetical protein